MCLEAPPPNSAAIRSTTSFNVLKPAWGMAGSVKRETQLGQTHPSANHTTPVAKQLCWVICKSLWMALELAALECRGFCCYLDNALSQQILWRANGQHFSPPPMLMASCFWIVCGWFLCLLYFSACHSFDMIALSALEHAYWQECCVGFRFCSFKSMRDGLLFRLSVTCCYLCN